MSKWSLSTLSKLGSVHIGRLVICSLPFFAYSEASDPLSFLKNLFGDDKDGADLSMTKTEHVLHVPNFTPLPYTATVGTIPVVDLQKDTNVVGSISFIGYTVKTSTPRPLTFIFPGGPGGAGGAEVLIAFGPKRLLTPDEGKTLLPPYELIENPETLLPWTDLVFVDPMNTGFGRYGKDTPQATKSMVQSVEGDLELLAQFVRHYISYENRWHSPKYLMGASYGTLRCAGLALALGPYDLSLHGLILLSCAIDFNSLVGEPHNFFPDCFLIPTYAATAWYHGRLWPEKTLEEVVNYARQFALHSYIPFNLYPMQQTIPDQEQFYHTLSHLIGLPLSTVQRYLGRVDASLYTQEFFAAERKSLGCLDTRYSADLEGIKKSFYEDPSYFDVQGLDCALNAYLRTDLNIDDPFTFYHSFQQDGWNFFTYDSYSLPNFIQRIRRMMIRNPQMKLFVGSGYFDARTPFAATEYAFNQLGLPTSYQKNIQFEYYPAGHGFVFHKPSLQKIKADLIRFYGDPALPTPNLQKTPRKDTKPSLKKIQISPQLPDFCFGVSVDEERDPESSSSND